MNNLSSSYNMTLDWSRNLQGEPCQSFNKRYDTCDRLAVVLAKATMYSFVSSIYYIQNISDINFTVTDATYIKDIGKDILVEIKDLSTSDLKMADSQMYKYNVGKETIISYKDDILKLAEFMITGEPVPMYTYNLDVIDFFVYNKGAGFISNYIKYTHNHLVGTDNVTEVTLPFVFPVLQRNGYSIEFKFNPALTGVCVYNTNTEYEYPMAIKFLLDTNIANIGTDEYINILSSYSVCMINHSVSQLLACLKFIFKRTSIFHRLSEYTIKKTLTRNITTLLNKDYNAKRLLLIFLVTKVNTSECEIGRITTAILSTIDLTNSDSNIVTKLQYLLNGEISKEEYVNYINVDGIDNQPDNYWVTSTNEDTEKAFWVSLEADEEEEPEEEEPEEEDPTEGDDPEEEPGDDGDDEPSEDDSSDDGDDEDSEPEKEEKPKKKIPIKVPRNSFLLRMIPAEANTLDDWLYRIEVDNIICQVLDNPPEDISDETRILLSDFRKFYIYKVSIQSIWEFVDDLLEAVPKPNKPKE